MQHEYIYKYHNEAKHVYITQSYHNHHLPQNKLQTLDNLILPFMDSINMFVVYKQQFYLKVSIKKH